MNNEEILTIIKTVIQEEANALNHIKAFVNGDYIKAIDLIRTSKGKVIVTGMGKSGHVARKIAATMSSTGTLAVFLHSAEAQHGDLGMVSAGDVVIAISKSGESEELNAILPSFKKIGTSIIAITAERASTLAKNADAVLYCGVGKEACVLDLAPTSSTTAALSIGDALAIALMKIKDFKSEDFALFHPGGKLGRRLLLKVHDLMIPVKDCPILDPAKAKIEEVIALLGSSGLGVVLFSQDSKKLEGIMTDGDVRRLLNSHKAKIFDLRVAELVNRNPTSIDADLRAVDALKVMESRPRPLNVVPVLSGDMLQGLVRLHDLLKVS